MVALEETMNMLWKKIEKKHMERETKAHSWSLKIKIEAFWDKNGSFRRNNEHAVKKIKKKHMERENEAEIKIEVFWDKNGSCKEITNMQWKK